jgi:hypothetical protein
MTGFDKRVKRITLATYRITVAGATVNTTGKRIVAELHGDQAGDFLILREAGRKYRVTLSIAELYRRGLIAEAKR